MIGNRVEMISGSPNYIAPPPWVTVRKRQENNKFNFYLRFTWFYIEQSSQTAWTGDWNHMGPSLQASFPNIDHSPSSRHNKIISIRNRRKVIFIQINVGAGK